MTNHANPYKYIVIYEKSLNYDEMNLFGLFLRWKTTTLFVPRRTWRSFLLSLVCGPGKYKVGIPDKECGVNGRKRDKCVLCSGNKIKTVTGDEASLCVECPPGLESNSDHTACGKYHVKGFTL